MKSSRNLTQFISAFLVFFRTFFIGTSQSRSSAFTYYLLNNYVSFQMCAVLFVCLFCFCQFYHLGLLYSRKEYFKQKRNKNNMSQFKRGDKMKSAEAFICFLFLIYISVVLFSYYKSKKFFIYLLSTVLQGICALFAVNLVGKFISVHIPVNYFTVGVSAFGGTSGVILLLLCDIFM